MFSWEEDPLLISKENRYLIKENYINVYRALVWQTDFGTKSWMARTPFCQGKRLFTELNKYLEKLDLTKEEMTTYLVVEIERYTKQRTTSNRRKYTLLKRFKEDKINLIVLRVISLLISEKTKEDDIDIFLKFLNNTDYFTDYHSGNKFKTNLQMNLVLNNLAFYLVGSMFGDSSISKDIIGKGGSDQTFVDGHKNKKLLKYSKQYIEYLSYIIKKLYSTHSSIKKLNHANAYQLSIHCKWFSRYHHIIFDFPIGEKGNKLKLSTILTLLPEEEKLDRLKYFWRGVFDTDGTYHPKKLYISLSSKSRDFINSFKEFSDILKIKTSDVLTEKNGSYQINIHVESILDFIKYVGTDHPRRRLIAETYILKGPKRKIFRGINKNSLCDGFFNLEILGNDIKISNIHHFLKDLRKELNISQAMLAKLIGSRQQNIERYENGRRNIRLSLLLKIAKLKGYSKEDVYKLLEKYNFALLIGDNSSVKLEIPLKPTQELNEFARYLRPLKNSIQVLSTAIKTKKIKEIFGLKVNYAGRGAYYVNSKTLSDFLKTYYVYELPWKGQKMV